MLRILDQLPAQLAALSAPRLGELLAGPTLIRLPGQRPEPLFVSVLLHGNETAGWDAVRTLLAGHHGRRLPRALTVLIGNVAAAREGRRHLDGQPDYNRIWRGSGTPEHEMAARVIEAVRADGPFAAIDVHNNSGDNPHYACVNTLDPEALELASMFDRRVVYSTEPDSVLGLAMSRFCPAVTLECGKVGDPRGAEHARAFLERCLHLEAFPERRVPAGAIELYRSVARVRVAPWASLDGRAPGTGLRLRAGLERLNFRELAPGTVIGELAAGGRLPVEVHAGNGEDLAERYFALRGRSLVTRRALIPAMLTLDARIIRQDCLCYLMERCEPAARAAC